MIMFSKSKGAWPDQFLDHTTHLNLFQILVLIDGYYFSHSHTEIWHSKIEFYEEIIKRTVVTKLNKTINNMTVISPTTSKQNTNL